MNDDRREQLAKEIRKLLGPFNNEYNSIAGCIKHVINKLIAAQKQLAEKDREIEEAKKSQTILVGSEYAGDIKALVKGLAQLVYDYQEGISAQKRIDCRAY